MKKLCILFISCLFLFSCDFDNSDKKSIKEIKTFSGKVEKGALQKGATITASEWSVSGGYSGKVYTTETLNNLDRTSGNS